jgi:hypothetical protein
VVKKKKKRRTNVAIYQWFENSTNPMYLDVAGFLSIEVSSIVTHFYGNTFPFDDKKKRKEERKKMTHESFARK